MSLLIGPLARGSGGGGGVVTPPGGGGGGGGNTPPPDSGGGPGSGGGTAAGVGHESIVWVDARGNATQLAEANGIIITGGPLGRGLPKFNLAQDQSAALDGAVLRNVAVLPRDISIPIAFIGKDVLELRDRQRTWLRRFNPRAGDGRLQFVFADGTTRELQRVRYVGGLEFDEQRATSSLQHLRAVITFRAFDPWAYDTKVVKVTLAGGTQTAFYPLLPFTLSAGALGTPTPITNDGDAPAWPVWTIQGPASGITISLDNGETIKLPGLPLTGSQSLTIDTRPRRKTITRDDGTNLYGYLSNDSVMFPLPEGQSYVTATVGGSSGTTLASVEFQRTLLSAA